MTNQLPSRADAAPKQTPSDADRIAALELFAQQLVFVLDAQGSLHADALDRWLTTATCRMNATGSTPASHVHALRRLQELAAQ